MLYTVSFTTKKLIHKYDSKGKIIGTSSLDMPIVMHALPHDTAMSYSIADDFKMVPYVPDERRTAKGASRDASVGNGTKRVDWSAKPSGERVRKSAPTASSGMTSTQKAAARGDLTSAING